MGSAQPIFSPSELVNAILEIKSVANSKTGSDKQEYLAYKQRFLMNLIKKGICVEFCENLLHSLETCYIDHLIHSLNASPKLIHELNSSLKISQEQIWAKIYGLQDKNISSVFRQLSGPFEPKSTTLERYLYIIRFWEAWESSLPLQEREDIKGFLFFQNCNLPQFLHLLVADIIEDASLQKTAEGKLDILTYHLGEFTIRPVSNTRFSVQSPCVKEYVLKWLKHEIASLKRQIGKGTSTQLGIPEVSSKLKVSISVEELAILSKALFEAGIFAHDNNKDFFKAIAQNIGSDKVGNISYNSLYNKQYEWDSRAREQVKGALKKALAKLDQDFS